MTVVNKASINAVQTSNLSFFENIQSSIHSVAQKVFSKENHREVAQNIGAFILRNLKIIEGKIDQTLYHLFGVYVFEEPYPFTFTPFTFHSLGQKEREEMVQNILKDLVENFCEYTSFSKARLFYDFERVLKHAAHHNEISGDFVCNLLNNLDKASEVAEKKKMFFFFEPLKEMVPQFNRAIKKIKNEQ